MPCAGSSTGLIRRQRWPGLREHGTSSPRTGGMRFFGTNDNTVLFNVSGIVEHARQLDVHDQLQRDPPLDHPVDRSLPDAVAGGPHQVLRIDPDRDHRDLAQLRQHGPAVLGRVHRLRARLPANVRGHLHGHQRHQRHGRLRQRFHLGNRKPQLSSPRTAIHELYG